MKLVYGITVSNELKEITTLINLLQENTDDEIVVLCDSLTATHEVFQFLQDSKVPFYYKNLDGDFGSFKTELNNICKEKHNADYVFQLDADETISEFMIKNIKTILEHNPDVELLYVPRINIVNGITDEYVLKWGWSINDNGYINFPDIQGRIYKSNLVWVGKVHEVINSNNYGILPRDEEYCIKHIKDIEKQIKQNNFYKTL